MVYRTITRVNSFRSTAFLIEGRCAMDFFFLEDCDVSIF